MSISANQTPKKADNKKYQKKNSFYNAKTQSSMNNKISSFKTNENKTADGFNQADDFDRRSAGGRFGFAASTSAYHEFIKVNHVFSGGAPKMRRNSCSQSQSHSRVRMQPSIYHQDDEFQKDKFTVRIKDLQHHTEMAEQIKDLKLTNKSNQS